MVIRLFLVIICCEFLKVIGVVVIVYAVGFLISVCFGRVVGLVKIGVLLLYFDIYVVFGESIIEGMKMYFDEVGNEVGG